MAAGRVKPQQARSKPGPDTAATPGHKTSGHKTPCRLTRGLRATLLHGFPQRRWIVLGDAGLASHDPAWFAHRHRARLTLVGRLRGDANLYALPDARRRAHPGRGRCRKGRKLPSPRAAVAAAAAPRQTSVAWYGNHTRSVGLVSAWGGWDRGRGQGRAALVPLRWVYVHEPRSDRGDYFYSTDPTMTPTRIVELFAARWSIEVNFQEARAHLGLETPRARRAASMLRTTPGLLGLFSLIRLTFARSLAGDRRRRRRTPRLHHTPCYHKRQSTFADALYAVRRDLWARTLLQRLLPWQCRSRMGPRLTNTLLAYLAEAA